MNEVKKHYLVSIDVGAGVIESKVIEMPMDYIPYSDSMMGIKKEILEKYKPRLRSSHVAPPQCGGYIGITDGRELRIDEIDIIAISNLDV